MTEQTKHLAVRTAKTALHGLATIGIIATSFLGGPDAQAAPKKRTTKAAEKFGYYDADVITGAFVKGLVRDGATPTGSEVSRIKADVTATLTRCDRVRAGGFKAGSRRVSYTIWDLAGDTPIDLAKLAPFRFAVAAGCPDLFSAWQKAFKSRTDEMIETINGAS